MSPHAPHAESVHLQQEAAFIAGELDTLRKVQTLAALSVECGSCCDTVMETIVMRKTSDAFASKAECRRMPTHTHARAH